MQKRKTGKKLASFYNLLFGGRGHSAVWICYFSWTGVSRHSFSFITFDVCFIFRYDLLFDMFSCLYPFLGLDHSATERRSRMHFMRQWSQVGPNRRGRITHDMLETWAESLNGLLDSQSKSQMHYWLYRWFKCWQIYETSSVVASPLKH